MLRYKVTEIFREIAFFHRFLNAIQQENIVKVFENNKMLRS